MTALAPTGARLATIGPTEREDAGTAHMSHGFGFPVFLEVRGRTVVVAGGGREPAAKATTLASLGALVRLWVPERRVTARLVETPGIELSQGPFAVELLVGATLAIVGTGDPTLDHRIAAEARARGVLVNTVDDSPFCDYSFPAVLRRGDLTIAVATGGIAPALAVRLRDRLAETIGDEYGRLLELFAELRPGIMASERPFAERRRLWYELVDGEAIDDLRAGRREAARGRLRDTVAAWLARGRG